MFTAALAALCFALPSTAQKIQVAGGQGSSASTTLIMFGDSFMGGMCITYGQPQWQAKYDGMMDMLKGHLSRLGMNWFTTFSTSVDIDMNGTKVAAGTYVLGLDCDKDGKFGLAFLDAGKAMKQGAMPFPTNEKGELNWKADFVAPLTLHKGEAKEVVEKLTLELTADEKDPSKGSFTLAWGKHTLTANLAIHIPK